MQTTLYYREGSSDKVYQVSLEPNDNQFVVNFAFGRRGSTLQTGTKTASPVDYQTALKLFQKLVREKKAKGYTEGPNGSPYQYSDKQVSGIKCQLLNPIDEAMVAELIRDTHHCAQEKYDGKRMLVLKASESVSGINRKGLIVGVPLVLVESAKRLPGDFILDGEIVGDTLYAFDLLAQDGKNLTPRPYQDRFVSLLNLLAAYRSHHQFHHIQMAPTASTPETKAQLLAQLKAGRKEGIVFKRWDAPYTPGRPNSGGSQLKHKFYSTLSAVVAKANAQRSVEIKLMDAGKWVGAGKVTIPANATIPKVGVVVEIRYLYAFKESGALYQPSYLGERDDIEPSDCKTSKLKYKAEEES